MQMQSAEKFSLLTDSTDNSSETLTSTLRVVAASAGAAIFWIDPHEMDSRRPFAYAVLLGFVAYSLASHLLMLRRMKRVSMSAAPWIDLGWATLLIAISEGTSSIFFQLYLFAILVASFHGGFRAGMALVAGSVFSFSVVGGLTAPVGPSFELDRSLIRPLYLLVLGYLISHWGEHECRLRRRMALLREVTSLSNPRFGIDRMVARLLSAVRRFHGVDACRLVVRESHGYCWTRAAGRDSTDVGKTEVPAAIAGLLLPPGGWAAFIYARGKLRSWRESADQQLERVAEVRDGGDELATTLDAREVVSVPFPSWPDGEARLYLVSQRPRRFDRSDVQFLQHVVDQVAPVLNSIQLVDKLATDAANEERRRIARDIHDSIIQPYIGLRLGLGGVGEALDGGRTQDARAGVARLAELVESEVAMLRQYARGLSNTDASTAHLLPHALERFCARFSETTGIKVTLATQLADELNDRVTAEVFQMVAEGLSNVRRHTEASRANVRVASCDGWLRLNIENERAHDGNRMAFSPRSLTNRALALGGRLDVLQPNGRTVLQIDVPL